MKVSYFISLFCLLTSVIAAGDIGAPKFSGEPFKPAAYPALESFLTKSDEYHERTTIYNEDAARIETCELKKKEGNRLEVTLYVGRFRELGFEKARMPVERPDWSELPVGEHSTSYPGNRVEALMKFMESKAIKHWKITATRSTSEDRLVAQWNFLRISLGMDQRNELRAILSYYFFDGVTKPQLQIGR